MEYKNCAVIQLGLGKRHIRVRSEITNRNRSRAEGVLLDVRVARRALRAGWSYGASHTDWACCAGRTIRALRASRAGCATASREQQRARRQCHHQYVLHDSPRLNQRPEQSAMKSRLATIKFYVAEC